jgi:hypothetical protein
MNLNTQANFEFLTTAHRRMKKRIKTEVVYLYQKLGGDLTAAQAEMRAKFNLNAADASLTFTLPLTIAPDDSGLAPHSAKLIVTDMAFDGSQPTGGGHFFEFMLELRDDRSTRCHYSHHRVSVAGNWVKAGKAAGDALYHWLLLHAAPGRDELKPVSEELQWSQPTEDEQHAATSFKEAAAPAAPAAPAPDASLVKTAPRWAEPRDYRGFAEHVAAPVADLVTFAKPAILRPGPFEGTTPEVTHAMSSARQFSPEELVSEQDKIWDRYWASSQEHPIVELEVPRAIMRENAQSSIYWAISQARQLLEKHGGSFLRMTPVFTEHSLEGDVISRSVGSQWIYFPDSNRLAVREEVPFFAITDANKYSYSVYGMEDGTYVDLLEKADLSFWMPEQPTPTETKE